MTRFLVVDSVVSMLILLTVVGMFVGTEAVPRLDNVNVREFGVVSPGVGSKGSAPYKKDTAVEYCEDGGGASIEMPLGVMYELDMSAGSGVLVAVLDTSGKPVGVERRFDIVAGMMEKSLLLGSFYIYCTAWPSPALKGKEIRCNRVATAMLGHLGESQRVAIVASADEFLQIHASEDVRTMNSSLSVCVNAAIAPREAGEGVSLEGDMQQAVTTQSRTPKRNTPKKKAGHSFVHMSPSMRKSMQENAGMVQHGQGTPHVKNAKDDGTPKHTTMDVALIREALDRGGSTLTSVLSSVLRKNLNGVWLIPGNVFPFWFLDAYLVATVFSSPFGASARRIGKATHIDVHTSGPPHTGKRDTTYDDTMTRDIGYAGEAVEAISDNGSQDAIAMSVFHAAQAGYLSLKHVENMHVGGMELYVSKLRAWISYPLSKYERFREQGVLPPTGVLLYGPPGTGKTLLARWIAHDAGAKLFIINGSELMSEFLGESEKCLSAIFQAAIALSPSIIFIDEIDVLAPSRELSLEGMSKAASRLIATLTGALDSLYGHAVMVLGATNRRDSIDESLRRPRRLDKELEIGVPNPQARYEILDSLLQSVQHEVSQGDIRRLSLQTHGYVGADLMSLCSEASMIALRRFVSEGSGAAVVSVQDMEIALHHTKPSALREFATEIPNVLLSDVGGHHEIKQKLKEAVEWPIKFKDRLDGMGAVPPKGILLYGPPGCSKTLLVKAIAGECRLNFFSVKGPELMSKYVGESEKALSHIFDKARKASPAILFFDEIDGLVGARSQDASTGHVDVSERVLSQMLQEMDGIKGKDDQVIIIGATNRMDRLDKALLRPGRFDQALHVSLPSAIDRLEIFKIHLKEIPIDSSVSLDDIVQKTQGCSGADIASICQKAAMHALYSASVEGISATSVTQNDFNTVIKM